jgi:protease-4
MSRKKYFIGCFVAGCFAVFICLTLMALIMITGQERGTAAGLWPDMLAGNKIGLVSIEGVITDSREILDKLNRFSRKNAIRGIVIRIESPGGGIAAAQEIHREILRIREEKSIPVVTSMGNVSASGGLYVACASDKIFANPGTITGSIGVIAEWLEYSELMKWAKLNDVVFKSGQFKDSGSGRKKVTEEEALYFSELIDELFRQFVKDVAESRSLPYETVLGMADGKAFSGQKARDLGLVDHMGNLYDAIRETARLAGIEGEPFVVEEREEEFSILNMLVDRLVSGLLGGMESRGRSMQFQYRW